MGIDEGFGALVEALHRNSAISDGDVAAVLDAFDPGRDALAADQAAQQAVVDAQAQKDAADAALAAAQAAEADAAARVSAADTAMASDAAVNQAVADMDPPAPPAPVTETGRVTNFDGTVTVTYSDGSTSTIPAPASTATETGRTTNADGTITVTFSDGTTSVIPAPASTAGPFIPPASSSSGT